MTTLWVSGTRPSAVETAQMTVREAGLLGGLATQRKHGQAHYAAIGRKGGAVTALRGADYYAAIGQKGGRKTAEKGSAYYAGISGRGRRKAAMRAAVQVLTAIQVLVGPEIKSVRLAGRLSDDMQPLLRREELP